MDRFSREQKQAVMPLPSSTRGGGPAAVDLSLRGQALEQLAALARRSPPPIGAIVQRTAWEKAEGAWKRQDRSDGKYEKGTDGENTPPPSHMGSDGWHFSSTTNRYYKNYEEYRTDVRPYVDSDLGKKEGTEEERKNWAIFNEKRRDPPEFQRPLMTAGVEAETELLKENGGQIVFNEDMTRNYLLWSVPTYTGKNMLKGSDGLSIEDLSGEAAAEQRAKGGEGYMMKQTQEHIEALTALKMLQADENIQKSDIRSQYKSTDKNSFDLKRIDPLHNPRDPNPQTDFIEIMKAIGTFFRDGRANGAAILKLVTDMTKDGDLSKRVGALLNQHDPEKIFNQGFYATLADDIMTAISAQSSQAGGRDDEEEVTRVPLKDRSNPELVLVGGRQAVFDTIWGPKSTEVVTKAANRSDSVQSHGLRYHWNPKTTVQAKHEFPPYLVLVRKNLDERIGQSGDDDLKNVYAKVLAALQLIISTISQIDQRPEDMDLDGLAGTRKQQMATIEEQNAIVLEGMRAIRKKLSQ